MLTRGAQLVQVIADAVNTVGPSVGSFVQDASDRKWIEVRVPQICYGITLELPALCLRRTSEGGAKETERPLRSSR